MNKRTKAAIAVGAGVATLLILASALLLRPTSKFHFLNGARFDGVWTRTQRVIVMSPSGPTHTPPTKTNSTIRRYWLPQSLSDVERIATKELRADGWDQPIQTANRLKDTFYVKDHHGSIQIMSHDGGSLVVISSETKWVDSLQSWLWKSNYSPAEGQLAR